MLVKPIPRPEPLTLGADHASAPTLTWSSIRTARRTVAAGFVYAQDGRCTAGVSRADGSAPLECGASRLPAAVVCPGSAGQDAGVDRQRHARHVPRLV